MWAKLKKLKAVCLNLIIYKLIYFDECHCVFSFTARGSQPDPVCGGTLSQQRRVGLGAGEPIRGGAEAEGDPGETGAGEEEEAGHRAEEGGSAQEKCVRVRTCFCILNKHPVTRLNSEGKTRYISRVVSFFRKEI